MSTIQGDQGLPPEHPFFKGLDPALIEFLAGCARNVHFKEGEIVFREGDTADTFYVIRKAASPSRFTAPAAAA